MKKDEFKPYIPADKITPEFTVTSVIMGILLAIIFGRSQCVSWSACRNDCICFYSGSSYFHGCYPRHYEKGFNP